MPQPRWIPPFAWGSGVGVADVSRKEAIELGLISDGELREKTAEMEKQRDAGTSFSGCLRQGVCGLLFSIRRMVCPNGPRSPGGHPSRRFSFCEFCKIFLPRLGCAVEAAKRVASADFHERPVHPAAEGVRFEDKVVG